jgi:DUF1365 family protein
MDYNPRRDVKSRTKKSKTFKNSPFTEISRAIFSRIFLFESNITISVQKTGKLGPKFSFLFLFSYYGKLRKKHNPSSTTTPSAFCSFL